MLFPTIASGVITRKEEWGSNAEIRGSFAQRKENFGVQEKQKKKNNLERMCGVQAIVIPELPFILVSRSTSLEFVSSPMLTGVVNYYPIRVQIVRLFLGIQSLFILII